MSIYGNLSTMNLPDLLQWASTNRKTGVLELERHKVCRRIQFREGRIVSCSSNETAARLGQFLISRGKITRDCLRLALEVQEQTGQSLPDILIEMQVVSREEIESQVAAKAEETIYGLFDWNDSVFRYFEGASQDPYLIDVNLSVEDVMLNGIQRLDELERMRQIFVHSGIVLGLTDQEIPAEITASGMARRVLQLVDGKRMLAEILIHSQASEFLVAKFLFMLHRRGTVRIVDPGSPNPEAGTLFDLAPEVDPATMGRPAEVPESDQADPVGHQRHAQIELANRLITEQDHRQALEILDACYRENPDDNHLRQLVLQAESGYLTQVRNGQFDSSKVPVPVPDAAEKAAATVSSNDQFLLSLIDGKSDIKSVVWVAPMREVDVLKTIERLVDHGLVEMRDRASDDGNTESTEGFEVKSVEWSPF